MSDTIGQGHGVEGSYAGLPEEFSNFETAKIVILPVPFDKTTTYGKGTDKGPEGLIEASRNLELYDIETDSEVYKKGIHTAKAIDADTSEKMLQDTYEATKKLLTKNKFVGIIGGEHSISSAPIRAFAEHFQSLTVLQFDAHADLQPAYEGNPLSHASVMARVKEMTNVKKIVSVGIRSMSSEELPLVDKDNTFYAHALTGDWMSEVLSRLDGPIYITFDIDAFDSSLMPSTGTPEPGGLFWNDALPLLKRVLKEKNVVGFDVVELAPNSNNQAPDYLAAKLVYKILSYKFS